MTTSTLTAPLPPEMLAKATEALHRADWMNWDAEHAARVALEAADVPELLAEIDSLREHLNALILENGLTASQLRARIQKLTQQPDGTPSARVRALIDANHALTQQREEARAEIDQLRAEQADNLRAAQSIAAELVAQRNEARSSARWERDSLSAPTGRTLVSTIPPPLRVGAERQVSKK